MVGQVTSPVTGMVGLGGKALGHLPGSFGAAANAFGDQALQASWAGHQMLSPHVPGGRMGDHPLEHSIKGEAARMRATGDPGMANARQRLGQGGIRAAEILTPGRAGKGLLPGIQAARGLRAAAPMAQAAQGAATAAPAAASVGSAAANPFPASMAQALTATGRGAAAAAPAAASAAASSPGWIRSALQYGVVPTAASLPVAYGLEHLLGGSSQPPPGASLSSVASHPGTWIGLLGLLSLLGRVPPIEPARSCIGDVHVAARTAAR
jgi:hypothetical protein